ncbi:MAG: hypothetical protein PHD81_01070 [Candidatus Nanoarchaeia archaeon]|nr:hypothetical protein [Candidatus Nanoarchaeia archaeon]MDD5587682.1 hypothetical protein [Candidatus Nanoarchaeia archaeon]
MDTKDKTIIGLVVLLVLAVLLASGILTTGKVIKVSCQDTDGGSIYMQGTVTGTDSGGTAFDPQTDYCSMDDSTGKTLVEFNCNVADASGYNRDPSVYCANGCQNGACLQ